MRLTTARYYTPSGRSIQAKGIKPDIESAAGGAGGGEGARRDEGRGVAARPSQGRRRGAGRIAVLRSAGAKDDKALNLALDLMRGAQKNPAFPPNPKTAVPN